MRDGHQKSALLRSTHAEKVVALLLVGAAESRKSELWETSAKKLKTAVSRVQKASAEKLMEFGASSRAAVEAVKRKLDFETSAATAALEVERERLSVLRRGGQRRRKKMRPSRTTLVTSW